MEKSITKVKGSMLGKPSQVSREGGIWLRLGRGDKIAASTFGPAGRERSKGQILQKEEKEFMCLCPQTRAWMRSELLAVGRLEKGILLSQYRDKSLGRVPPGPGPAPFPPDQAARSPELPAPAAPPPVPAGAPAPGPPPSAAHTEPKTS